MFKEREEMRDAIATEPKSVIAGAIIEDGDRKHGARANPCKGRVEFYLAEIVPPSMSASTYYLIWKLEVFRSC